MIPVLLTAALVFAPLPAHASVTNTNPADGATLTEAVETFSVTVNEDILQVEGVDTSNIINITDSNGLYYGAGCSTVSGDTLSLEAGLGAPGQYTMAYVLVSADGHQIGDSVAFTWAPSGDVEAFEGSTQAPVCGETVPATGEGSETMPDAESPEQTPISAPATEAPPAEAVAEATASSETATPIAEQENSGWMIAIAAAVTLAVIGAVVALIVRTRRRSEEP